MSLVNLANQSTDPNAPASGRLRVYSKDRSLFIIDDLGNITNVGAQQANRVFVSAKKGTVGADLTKGTAVYVTGYDDGDGVFLVEAARSNSSSTMPVLGIVDSTVGNVTVGEVLILGELTGIDTSSWGINDLIYPSSVVAGALVNAPPVGPNLTQRVAIVAKVAVDGALSIDINEELRASDASPLSVGTADPGTAVSLSRADHVHAHGDQARGTQHQEVTIGEAGFMSASDKGKLNGIPADAVSSTRQVIAGGGLTGGGDLSADRTFDVVANTDGSIQVNPDDIGVGVLATDTQHGSRGGGSQHSTAVPSGAAGFLSGADKAKLDGITPGAEPNTVDSVFGRTGTVVAQASDYDADQVDVDILGTPGYDDLQDHIDTIHSAGWISGGAITPNGVTIDVAAGVGTVRTSNSSTAPVLFFNWPAAVSLVIGADETRYIVVDYNGGAPTVAATATFKDWDNRSRFLLGCVVREGSILHISDVRHVAGDAASLTNEYLRQVHCLVRDGQSGGLILGETGTRNVTMSAGALWQGLNRFAIPAIDTSASDTFDRYYRNGIGGWVKQTSQTQWPNTQWDDNSGTLQTMTNGYWSVLWFYIDVEGGMAMLFGQQESATRAEAELQDVPSDVPDRAALHGSLIGRIVFQKSASTGHVESRYEITFGGVFVSNHGDLAGLLNDDHIQYQLRSEEDVANGYAGLDSNAVVVSPIQVVRETSGPTNLSVGSIADGQVLQRQGSAIVGASIDPRDIVVFDHFVTGTKNVGEFGNYGWAQDNAGVGSSFDILGERGHPGYLEMGVGTNAAGYCCVHLGDVNVGANIILNGANPIEIEALIRVNTVSSANLEGIMVGIGSDWETAVELTDGVYVRFFPGATATFAMVAAQGGSRTIQNGSTTVAANVWYRVGFVVTPGVAGAPASVQMYVNGLAEGLPVTTNFPTVLLGVGMCALSAGGAGAAMDVDYVLMKQVTDKED